MSYGTSVTLQQPFADVIPAVKAALATQGFGVLTEIDVQATMKAKLGEDMPAYVILGACNPPLAHRALSSEASIGLLLPCNVVVRETAEGTLVEAIDPMSMVHFTGNADLGGVAEEATARLAAALATLRSGDAPVPD
jgi:uncharacterized protein (DUF302 family)